MEEGPRCSLQEMLDARDRRRERQRLHFLTSPESTLAVATVVAPGEHKLTHASGIVAEAMTDALKREFGQHILAIEHLALVSGHEIWLTLSCPPEEVKTKAVALEDSHVLGRLFDIDVIMPEMRPISRTAVGMDPRKCLLCGNEARLCMRLRRHSADEIKEFIETLVNRYVNAE